LVEEAFQEELRAAVEDRPSLAEAACLNLEERVVRP
jgi:hypothetical protein